MRTIRLKLNTKQCYKCLATDSITGKQPVTWRANATNIEVGVFTDDTPIDLTGFTNLELVVRPDRVTADNVAYNLVAAPDSDTITLVGWDAGTDQHVTFSLADNELNLDLDGKESKSYWLAITGTDASGNETTFGTSWLTVEEDNNATADPPPEYPGAGIGENIIDAKGDLIVGLADNTPDRIAVGTNGQILIADSAEALGVKWGTASGTGDLLASNNLSDVANAATSLANLGGLASTDIDTLAELNAVVTDATIGDSSDFATAAQGTTADSASQPGHYQMLPMRQRHFPTLAALQARI